MKKSKKYTLQGSIHNQQQQLVQGLTVLAIDLDFSGENLLGQIVKTDEQGFYEINYSDADFRIAGKETGGADIIVRAFDQEGRLLGKSELHRNAKKETTINLTVEHPLQTKGMNCLLGKVTYPNGRAAAHFFIQALGMELHEEHWVGEALVQPDGQYIIFYEAREGGKPASNDLFIKVFDQKHQLVFTSPIYFNAAAKAVINARLDDAATAPPSEFAYIQTTLLPHLKGLLIESLNESKKHRDISFLSGKTGLGYPQVEAFVLAHRLAVPSKIEPPFWFALLRMGILNVKNGTAEKELEAKTQQILDQCKSIPAATIRKSLQLAIKDRLIDGIDPKTQDQYLTALQSFLAARRLKEKPQDASRAGFQTLVGLTPLTKTKKERLAGLYQQHLAFDKKLVAALREDQVFNEKEIADLETTFQLSPLTVGHVPLVRDLKKQVKKTEQIRQLAKLDNKDWERKIKALPEDTERFPVEIAGNNEQERIGNYAQLLEHQFVRAFPTTAFAGRLEKDNKTAIKEKRKVVQFLNQHPGFELHRNSVEGFFKKQGLPLNGANQKLVQSLKSTQRVFKLTPTYPTANALLADGLQSASDIYGMERERFIQKYGNQPGFTVAVCEAIYDKATVTYGAVVTIMGDIKANRDANLVQALSVPSEALEGFPNLENLFQMADICDCKQCRSVYSPAAYFTDLLMWVKGRQIKDKLFQRRPDLAYIELTCENSHTPLPYIDLVNEVLEEAVAPNVFEIELSHEATLSDGTFNEPLRQSLAENGYPLAETVTINAVMEDDSAPANWILRDGQSTFLIRRNEAETALEVALLRQTRGTADSLRAMPSYLNEAAYQQLRTAKYPFSLPLDLLLAELRAYLEKSGVERWQLMELSGNAHTDRDITDEQIAAAFFNISMDEEMVESGEKDEYHLITESKESEDIQKSFWGVANDAELIAAVKYVSTFLQKTGLDYQEMQQLLSLHFIQGSVPVQINYEDNTCDTERQYLQPLTAPHLDRIHRFLRLWRKIGWQLWEVDYAIRHPKLGNGTLDGAFLKKLRSFCALKEMLPQLSTEQLGSLLGNINVQPKFSAAHEPPEPSLYEQLFLNKDKLDTIDPAFVLEGEDISGHDDTLNDHLATLTATLGITKTDLSLLLSLKKPDDTDHNPCPEDQLNLQHLSSLYRHLTLSRQLNLSVEEWAIWWDLFNKDIFAETDSLLDFLHQFQVVKQAGFTTEELDYVLGASGESTSAPTDDKISLLLTGLRKELKAIDEALNPADLPTDVKGLGQHLLGLTTQLERRPEEAQRAVEWLSNQTSQSKQVLDLPELVFPANTQISYDKPSKVLSFQGIMTDHEKVALRALSDLEEYRLCIDEFYEKPRAFLTDFFRFFQTPVLEAPLASLPDSVAFATYLGEPLGNKFHYDTTKKVLQFTGLMTEAEKTEIDSKLPKDDADFNEAIEALYEQSTVKYEEGQTTIEDLLEPLIDDPEHLEAEGGDDANVVNLLQVFINATATYLQGRLFEDQVVSGFAEALGLSEVLPRQLLTKGILSGESILEEHFDSAFVNPEEPEELIINRAAFEALFNHYHWLNRVSLLLQKLDIRYPELIWLLNHASQVQVMDFARLPLTEKYGSFTSFTQLIELVRFNHLYEKDGRELLEIIEKKIEGKYAEDGDFMQDIHRLTGWAVSDLEELAGEGNWNEEGYKKLANWQQLEQAFQLLAKLQLPAESLLSLANPTVSLEMVETIRKSVRSRLEYATWLEYTQSIQDILRERKRDALTAYLLTQPAPEDVPSGKWATPADLYAYYLVDVEMNACLLSSRLVQASGAVQLFVQRCLMGLEPTVKPNEQKDDGWKHWEWMQNYRVWEANRKVFLYPENWIEPELRPEKSQLFAELENELQQSEVNNDNVEKAFLNYLDKLDGIAQLEIAGTWYEGADNVLHVFARTTGQEPHIYYYRKWIDDRRWTPWEKLDIDIKGNYLVPLMHNQRLYLVWPEFQEEPVEAPMSMEVPEGGEFTTVEQPQKRLKIFLALSEFRNGNWSPKKVSKDYLLIGPFDQIKDGEIPEETDYAGLSKFHKKTLHLFPLDFTWLGDSGKFLVGLGYFPIIQGSSTSDVLKLGTFELIGCKGYPEKISSSDIEAQFKNLFCPGIGKKDFSLKFLPYNRQFERSLMIGGKNVEKTGDGALILLPDYTSISTTSIFNKTPGNFRVTSPSQMSYFDKWRAFLYFSLGCSNPYPRYFEDRFPVSLNTFLSWFYADNNRTFFVQPCVINEATGDKWYYKEFLQYLEEILKDLFSKEKGNVYDRIEELRESNIQLHFRNFYHPYPCHFSKTLYNKGIRGLMSRATQDPKSQFNFETIYEPTEVVAKDNPLEAGPDSSLYPDEIVDFAPDGSYASYNWELFYHAPLLIANRLSSEQRFEEAMQWYHYIFNPTDSSEERVPNKYWITKPFFKRQEQEYLEQRIDNILHMLADNAEGDRAVAMKDELEKQVKGWRDNPFEPHIVAQYRTVAYQLTTVMKYLDNLVAWGDHLFRQDTMESINQATQLYIMAAEILGPKPRRIPPRDKPATATFAELKWDKFSNALIELENLVPEVSGMAMVRPGVPPMPGFLYFCLPPNEKLLGYWDTVADRLFKIRNCLNIEGVARELSLFAPPIDPGLLVKARAAGLDIATALSDISAALPQYRFQVMLQKALALCNEVKSLGNALLSVLEKKDGEGLALLRQTHELALLEAVKQIRIKQEEEAGEMLKNAEKSKELITIRRDYYSSREFMNPAETAAVSLSGISLGIFAGGVVTDILGGAMALIADCNAGVAGVGGSPTVTCQFGGTYISKALELASRALYQTANLLDKSASISSTVGGYQRRKDDWDFQLDLAEKELEQVEHQIAAAGIRKDIATKELENQELQIEQSTAIDEYLKTKFTNDALYEWMKTQISTVFFQCYQMAYDLAKKAEQCYRYELGIENSSFIQFGHWDSLKQGLLSGDRLMRDLNRLDIAYLENNKRDFEITKNVSLKQLNPLALLQLRENGYCEFSLPEELFDFDFPGHYNRRIKAVSLSIPAIAGPYTSVNCTLRLLRNFARRTNKINGQYEHNHENGIWVDDPRFCSYNVPTTAIATSSAQNDSGVFELNFRDDRKLPFEGGGVISQWSLEMMRDKGLRQFDYRTITDVILTLRYTAKEDAGKFKTAATGHLNKLFEAASARTMARFFDLKHDFPNEWHRFWHPEVEGTENELQLAIGKEHFPFIAQGKTIKIQAVRFFVKMKEDGDFYVSIPENGADILLEKTEHSGELVEGGYFGTDWTVSEDSVLEKSIKIKGSTGNYLSTVGEEAVEMYMVVLYGLT